MSDPQPGQVIVPQSAEEPGQPQPGVGAPPMPVRPAEEPDDAPQPVPDPVPGPDQMATAPYGQPVAAPIAEPAQDATWQYQQSAAPAPTAFEPALPQDGITWTASEFIAHEKGAQWYGLLLLVGLAAASADYLLFRDTISSVIILLAVVAFSALSARKPRTQQYTITPGGLQIGAKAYFFQDFKNFSIAEEGAIASIVFMPMKRFMPALTIYVAPDMEDQVVDFLSALLPFEQHRADAVDSLMRRIRF